MVEGEKLVDELKAEGRRRGWAAVAITGMEPLPVARRRGLDAVRSGRMAGMGWMSEERILSATDLAARYPWGRSIIALAWPYQPVEPRRATPSEPARGRVAAYACLDADGHVIDYHELLARRCDELIGWLRDRIGDVRAKRFVDHGWAMDRAVAERAGLGFVGKHASLLTVEAGSYVLLAEVVVSVELPPDLPSARGCGTCRQCLPACPTGAIVAPGVIDARRCISYLTIEHRGSIPTDLRPLMDTWVFGCDLCQEACPINARRAPAARPEGEATTRSGPVAHPDLMEMLQLTEAEFAERFAGTPLRRAGRAALARNAAIALGNAGDARALAALRHSADHDEDPVVRESAGWAVSRLVEQPDGRARPHRDGSTHTGRDQGDRVRLRRPPGVGQRPADRHA